MIPAYETSVFINCPFDSEFEPLFDALVFATVCCRFEPRSAIEKLDAGSPRLDRIVRAMFSSKYSIHDLSRCRGEGNDNLARFNMPLELGMAMARAFMASPAHDWLVLIPKGAQYASYISDLAAFDPLVHDGSPSTVVPQVMLWLADRPGAVVPFTPSQVLKALPEYQTEVNTLRREWVTGMRWSDRLSLAIKHSRRLAASQP